MLYCMYSGCGYVTVSSHSISSCSDQLQSVSRDRDRLIEQLQQGAILFEKQLQAEQHKCKMITIHFSSLSFLYNSSLYIQLVCVGVLCVYVCVVCVCVVCVCVCVVYTWRMCV